MHFRMGFFFHKRRVHILENQLGYASERVLIPYVESEFGIFDEKHGEVHFPTQVRYDIVIFIWPLIVISALV